MIDVQEAVKSASKSLQQVLVAFEPSPPADLRLEEVELSDDDRHWLVTFSYRGVEPDDPTHPLPLALRRGVKRWKKIKLESKTGKFRGIKDRDL